MNNRQEATPEKWKSKIKKWIGGIIILGIVSGLLWVLVPLMWMRVNIYWQKMNRGIDSTYKDYYYVNIGGITYAKDKFYILLRKPYLFNISYGYIYSSKDLTNWDEEFVKDKIYTTTTATMILNNYKINDDGYTFVNRNINNNEYQDITNDLLPRNILGNCYVVNSTFSLRSLNCSGKWNQYSFISDNERSTIKNKRNDALNTKATNNIDVSSVVNMEYCEGYQRGVLGNNLLASVWCQPKLSKSNIAAYHVLHKIIKFNKLDILLDGSHTAYGDGKYVGIFYKNKQYYFIISTDSVNYRIEPAPSKLTSSLAIRLFN